MSLLALTCQQKNKTSLQHCMDAFKQISNKRKILTTCIMMWLAQVVMGCCWLLRGVLTPPSPPAYAPGWTSRFPADYAVWGMLLSGFLGSLTKIKFGAFHN